MRLISCNIYGFGALSDYNLVFDSRLHSIFGPNGFGKSTLFDFIRVMLYGMPSTRSNEVSLSMRSHYRPFGGKTYGGVLTLDTREGVISIERVFHATTAGKDTLKITDTFGNDLTSGKYKNISSLGYHFLGLDEEAYERTVAFREIGASDGVGTNKTISGKLNSIATSIDVGQYDRAIDALNEMIKSLSGKGTKNISTISRLTQELQKLTKDIKDLEALNESLNGYHQSLAGYKKEHSALETEVEKARRINNDRVLWDNYQKMLDGAQQLRQELKTIMDKYPKGIPTKEISQKIRDTAQQLRTIEIALENQGFTASEAERLNQLKERYPNGPIPMSVLEQLGNDIFERNNALKMLDQTKFLEENRLEKLWEQFRYWSEPDAVILEHQLQMSQKLDRQTENIETTQLVEQPQNTLGLNGSNIPTDLELQHIETLANQFKNNELQIQALAAQPAPTKSKYNKPVAIIGLIVIALGIVMQVTGVLNYGVAVMFFGLAVMMFSFLLKGSGGKDNQNNPALALSQQNVVLEHQLKTFFTRYQRYGTDFLAYYQELKDAANQFKEYLQRRENQMRNIQREKASLESSRKEIADYITKTMGLEVKHIYRLNAEGSTYGNIEGDDVNNRNVGANRVGSYVRRKVDGQAYSTGDVSDNTNNTNNTNPNYYDRGSRGNTFPSRSEYSIGFDIDDESAQNSRTYNNNDNGYSSRYSNDISNNYSVRSSCYSYFDPYLRINLNLTQILKALVKEYDQYKYLERQYQEVEKKRDYYDQQVKKCTEKINDVLSQYKLSEDGLNLEQLRTDSVELTHLSKDFIENERRENELTEKKKDLDRIIESIYKSLSLSMPEDLTEAALKYEQDLERSVELNDKINEKLHEAEDYLRSIGLEEEPKVTLTEDEIKEKADRIKELGNAITRLSDQITQAEQEAAALPSLKEQWQQTTKELQDAEKELEIVRKTQRFIVQANKNLLDRYVRPIMDKYQDQIKRILPWLESVTMDHNYKVSFKKDTDVAHNCDHLSSGERTCLELALRLALIENMFHDDYPVLMMDDPFAELDPENLEKALEILRGISSKMQVVYFSCSPERRLG